jgi:ribose transport system ATP-binding protein
VLFISHRLEEIRSLCHRVTVLRDGTDVGSGLTADFTGRQLVHMVAGEAAESALEEERGRHSTGPRQVRARLVDFASPPELGPTTLEVEAGEIVGIAGLEGQGQLELFLSLYGARRSTGLAELDGKRLTVRSPAHAIARGIGLVPHDRGLALCLPLSIRDNVALGSLQTISRFGFIRRDREQAIVDEAMLSLRVRARNARSAVETLSGGNQQKVLLGRVLSLEPKLLLLYDPTRGVDVGTKAEIFHLVRRQAEAGLAVMFYSTDVSELLALCDRILVLHDGRIRAELVGEVTEQEIIGAVIGSGEHD